MPTDRWAPWRFHGGFTLVGLLAAAAIIAVPTGGAVRAGSRPGSAPASAPSAADAVIRLARSADGLVFTDAGPLPVPGASAPDLTWLPNGHLLALCGVGAGDRGGEDVLVVLRSPDEGAHWSRPQAIRLGGLRTDRLRFRRGHFAWMADGRLRLYFIAQAALDSYGRGPTTRAASEPAGPIMILSAVTRNGLDYQFDPGMGLMLEGTTDPHLAVVQDGTAVHLLVTEAGGAPGTRPAGAPAALHLVSRDGKRFTHVERGGPLDPGRADCILRSGKGYRAYRSDREGIRSLASRDGAAWIAEEGVRLASGRDAAAIASRDGSVLMLYAAPAGAGGGSDAPAGQAGGMGDTSTKDDKEHAAAPAGSDRPDRVSPGSPADGAAWEPFASEPARAVVSGAEGGGVPPLVPGGPGRRGDDPSNENTSDGQNAAAGDDPSAAQGDSPPRPDFNEPVDYAEWLRQRQPIEVEGNAWQAYDAFMPSQSFPFQDSKPGWPDDFNDMLNSRAGNWPIAPWTPDEYPEWEATHQSIQGLLSQFREATRYERYVCPLFSPEGWNDGLPDGEAPLITCLLPSLSAHRTMTKATLADAWRAENGQVRPDRMIDAIETGLRNAGHMEQGCTLIHHLVSIAGQTLVRKNALKALEHNVFATPDQIEAALDTLRQHDRYDAAAASARWLPGEHGVALSGVQYLFTPAGPDGQPQWNPDRFRYLAGQYAESEEAATSARRDALAAMSPEEIRQSVDAIDSHFRELADRWRTGYPQVRAADLEALRNAGDNRSALTDLFMPNLSRAYTQAARNEATRRATQLTYEVHLFKARQGRWPQSLDELPLPPGEVTRVDPFTGGDFGYHLTDTGPKIYSLSENGRDDGGVHSRRWSDGVKSDADSDDYVFWPVQD